MANLTIATEELKPLVAEIVRATMAEVAIERSKLPDRVLSEKQAAEFLGLKQHSLAGERKRGKITASRIVGDRVVYLPSDLLGYVLGRRIDRESTERN